MLRKSRLLILLLLLSIAACRHEVPGAAERAMLQRHLRIPDEPYNYANPVLPEFFRDQFVRIQDNTPAGNPVTDWGATLGRVLFYDKQLSLNNTVSCGSCHVQEFGFSDTAQFSTGFLGAKTPRHSMALVNAKYYMNGRYFWDERAATLEDQVLMPIQDGLEMGMRLDSLVNRLQSTPYYPILFKYAFGNGEINPESISKALAQFVRSMVSYRSKYDAGRAMVEDREMDFPNFTPEENAGKRIFMTAMPVNCFGCHNTDVFITDNPRNNGINLDNNDPGSFVNTADPMDVGKFKASSLKNVALRRRYMHDGKFDGLESVLHHYNSGILANPNLDAHLRDNNGNPARMNLNATQLQELMAFLETLTDHEMVHDVKFSDPF